MNYIQNDIYIYIHIFLTNLIKGLDRLNEFGIDVEIS